MLKNKSKIITVSLIFIILELLLGVLIQIKIEGLTKYLSFSSVLLSCLFALLFFNDSNVYKLTQAGLLFTLSADIFLVLLNAENKVLAMCFFSVTQICYFLLLYMRDEKFRKIHIITRFTIITAAVIFTIIILGKRTDILSLISVFYFSNLTVNIIWAFSEWQQSKLLPLGLLLFSFCDIFIGFSALSSLYFPIPEGTLFYFFAHPGFNIAWMFYVPSQTLIALSLAEENLKRLKEKSAE